MANQNPSEAVEAVAMVTRSDDNGHTVMIRSDLSLDDATVLYESMLRGHKQDYRILIYAPGQRDAVIRQHGILV